MIKTRRPPRGLPLIAGAERYAAKVAADRRRGVDALAHAGGPCALPRWHVRGDAGRPPRTGIEAKFVKYPATFLGPDRHWDEPHDPTPKRRVAVYDEHGNATPEMARLAGLT